MDIDLLYVTDGPHAPEARRRLLSAIERAAVPGVFVREHEVTSPDRAAALGMAGSPTILLDGHVIAGVGEPGSLSCRLEELPTVADLAGIITRAAHA